MVSNNHSGANLLPNKMNGLNFLQTIFSSYSAEYFAKLGGSGRYPNYKEWHSAALVYILSADIPPPNFCQIEKPPYTLLPRNLWLETDHLPSKIYQRLNQKIFNEKNRADFANCISAQIQKSFSDPEELIGWAKFLTSFNSTTSK